jgi:regulator of protease activity HflC (stomatin/prohibitin superfamily)
VFYYPDYTGLRIGEKIMNRIFHSLIFIGLFTGSCVSIQVDPGQEAVLTDKPYFFGHGGVQPKAVSTGRIWVWASTEATLVDVKPVQYSEEFKDMMTKDDVPIRFGTFLQTRALDTPRLVEKWGPDWYEKNVKEPYRSIVRNLCKEYSMQELVSSVAVDLRMSEEAKKQVEEIIRQKGIPVEIQMSVIGKISPREEVMTAITATATQQQLQLTEQERRKTQQFRQGAETERAKADNAYMAAMGLSPDLFVKLEGIKTFERAVEACAGSKNCTLLLVPPNTSLILPNGK